MSTILQSSINLHPDKKPVRILIADDDPDIVDSLKGDLLLSRPGLKLRNI